jgi:hypothetical protein
MIIGEKGWNILSGTCENPNFSFPDFKTVSKYKPLPVYGFQNDESIKMWIDDQSKGFYFIVFDDMEISPSFQYNRNYVYGGTNLIHEENFLKIENDNLISQLSTHMCQFFVSNISNGSSIPIACFLRDMDEKFLFVEKKIKEIIEKISKIDDEKKIKIIGSSSDGDYTNFTTIKTLNEFNLKKNNLRFFHLVDISHLSKSLRNALYNRILTFDNEEFFSMVTITEEMKKNSSLEKLLSDNSITEVDIMNESFMLELLQDKVIEELNKSKENNSKSVAKYLTMIKTLFENFRKLDTEIKLEDKIKNLKKLKEEFISWKNNEEINYKNKLSIITFNNVINTIDNFLNMIEFIGQYNSEQTCIMDDNSKETQILETTENLKRKRLNEIEDIQKIKKKKLNNVIYNILSSCCSTLIVENFFSTIRFRVPFPTCLDYCLIWIYAWIIHTIIHCEDRGFSIKNFHQFENKYYGQIKVIKIPHYEKRKDHKICTTDKKLFEEIIRKLDEINFNCGSRTVRSNTLRKIFFKCPQKGCNRQVYFNYIGNLQNHLIKDHNIGKNDAKKMVEEYRDEITIDFNDKEREKRLSNLQTKPNKPNITVFTNFEYIKNNNENTHWLILDFETTGFKVQDNGIVQVSVYSFNLKKFFTTYIDPECNGKIIKFNPRAMKVNKILRSTVRDSPSIFTFLNDFQNFLSLKNNLDCVIIGHNCGFDKRFYDYNEQIYLNQSKKITWIDSRKIFKSFLKEENDYKLENLSKKYLENAKKFHDAEGDVRNLFDLLFTKCFENENELKDYIFKNKKKLEVVTKVKKIKN